MPLPSESETDLDAAAGRGAGAINSNSHHSKKNKKNSKPPQEGEETVGEVYGQLWRMAFVRPVQILFFVLLLQKLPFAGPESIA